MTARITPGSIFSRLNLTPGPVWHGLWPAGTVERNRRIYDYELVWFASGNCRVITAAGSTFCTPGSAIIIPPGVMHCTVADSAAERWCVHFDWMGECRAHTAREPIFVYEEEGDRFDPALAAAPPPPETGLKFPLRRNIPPEKSEPLLELLRGYFMQPGATLEEALLRRSLLFRLLALVLAGEQPSPAPERAGNTLFFRTKSLLDSRFTESGLSIAAIAREQRVTPNHLTKLFRRELGMSVRDYLHQRRLEYAEKLLTSESLSIGEIALAAGFTDPNYFIRFFHRRKGVSPGNFRKQTPSTVDRRIFSRKITRGPEPAVEKNGK